MSGQPPREFIPMRSELPPHPEQQQRFERHASPNRGNLRDGEADASGDFTIVMPEPSVLVLSVIKTPPHKTVG